MKTFKNPISGEEIQLAEKDFPEQMYFKVASRSCRQLGKGWRLPTKYEWEIILNDFVKNGDDSFTEGFYWTGSFEYDSSDYAYAANTKNAQPIIKSVECDFKVRAVKTMAV